MGGMSLRTDSSEVGDLSLFAWVILPARGAVDRIKSAQNSYHWRAKLHVFCCTGVCNNVLAGPFACPLVEKPFGQSVGLK